MKVDGRDMRPIWLGPDGQSIKVIDQRPLPHELVVADLRSVADVIMAIREMMVRGAPLIGVAGAWGVYMAVLRIGSDEAGEDALIGECTRLKMARPTAVNLMWAVDAALVDALAAKGFDARLAAARAAAEKITEMEVDNCRRIGEHGVALVREIAEAKDRGKVNILTHCNAGWLACVEYGTATAPIYMAHETGIPVHVWVDETRPLNQGARLTAWELGKAGIPHTVITDNAGGHLMRQGMVDMVIVGTDRTTRAGDVANKIGTYLKALAAWDNNIPFYVALPSSTFDWSISDGAQIPIEERSTGEVRYVQGWENGSIKAVMVPPEDSPALNPAFDITPARLVTAFITERGVCKATEADIRRLFPESRQA